MFSINEYNVEEEIKKLIFTECADAKEKGKLEGKIETARKMILSLLEHLGPVPESVKGYVMLEEDETVLERLHLVAAKSDTIEQFEEKIQI